MPFVCKCIENQILVDLYFRGICLKQKYHQISVTAKYMYSWLSLSRSPTDSLKYIEIPVLNIYIKTIVEKGRNEEQFLLLSTIFFTCC